MSTSPWQELNDHYSNPRFLALYKNVRSPRQWYEQVSVRIALQGLIGLREEQSKIFGRSDTKSIVERAAMSLKTNPIVSRSASPFNSKHFFDPCLDSIISGETSEFAGVRRMTLLDLFHVERTLPIDLSQSARRSFRAEFPESLAHERPEGLERSISPSADHLIYLSLDPTVSLDVIKNDFDDLLTEIRGSAPIRDLAKIRHPNLPLWSRMHLLACLDLLILVYALQITPPRGAVLNTLAPGRKADSTVTQTLMPLCRDLLDRTPRGVALMRRLGRMVLSEDRRNFKVKSSQAG